MDTDSPTLAPGSPTLAPGSPTLAPGSPTRTLDVNDFTDSSLGLSDNVIRGVYAHGFERPVGIQAKVIANIVQRRDVVAQAQSGTGKTAAFGIAAIERASRTGVTQSGQPAVVVLSHSRELVLQTAKTLDSLALFADVNVGTCCGGLPCKFEAIVVGTPGKILQCSKRSLDLSRVDLLVLDEVDELLRDTSTNCLRDQVHAVMCKLPPSTRLALFSATMPEPVRKTVRQFLENPCEILIRTVDVPLSGIAQYRLRCSEMDKSERLLDLLRKFSAPQTMVFTSTRERADELCAHLQACHLNAARIHGAMAQVDRTAAMRNFVNGDTSVLVCTNVLARGVDVQQVGLVVLYDITECSETYMHCIGRCGRYGRQGVSIAMCSTDADDAFLRACESLYSVAMQTI